MAVPLHSVEDGRRRDAPEDRSAASFECFFVDYAPRVRGLLKQYVGRGLADDLAQETLIRAHDRGLHLEEGRDPWPWLARVARNLATDASRRRGHLVEVSLEAADDDVPSRATPHSEWVAARRREGIATALTAIPDRSRRMLLARHLDGLRYDQIAETEGVSVAVVRSALFRAKRIFRQEYDGIASRRGIAALIPLGLGGLRRRVSGLRARLGALLSGPGTEGAFGAAANLNAVQGAVTGIMLGAVAAAGPLLPAGAQAASPPPRAEVAWSTGSVLEPPFREPSAVVTSSTSSAEMQAREPEGESDSQPEPAAGDVEVPRRVSGEVSGDEVVPGAHAPASAAAGGSAGGEGETAGTDYEAAVGVEDPPFDADGDGVTMAAASGKAIVDCSSPDEHGVVTGAVCGLETSDDDEADPEQ